MISLDAPDTGVLFVITGSSGTGKTTLIKQALKDIPKLNFSVSATNRAPRPGEKDGTDYYFLDNTKFDSLIKQGGFLEHAQVYGNRYGTLKKPVEDAIARGESILLDIDVQGADQIRKSWPKAVYIFILPPSVEELRKRLTKRNTDSEEVISKRMADAHIQLKGCGAYDYLIINDDLSVAHDHFQSIIIAELMKTVRRQSWVELFRS